MDVKTIRSRWRRLRQALRDDRGSHVPQELMMVLFWLGAILVVVGIIGPWVQAKAQEIIGF